MKIKLAWLATPGFADDDERTNLPRIIVVKPVAGHGSGPMAQLLLVLSA
ncbi:MAG TPA: hypothetical protein VE934_10450 [Polaromonas sp.]|nr:hypothetical protein [Polaromonas sp.]HYW57373.1 hypothetical protein [Polaromonas sp.]